MPVSKDADRNSAGEGGDQPQHRRLPSHAKPGASSSSNARVQKLVPDSDDDDHKPLFLDSSNDAPSNHASAKGAKKQHKARAPTPEVLELSSGSDSEATAQCAAIRAQQDAADAKRLERKQRADAARELIVAAVPDAAESFLAKTFARCGHDASKTVDEVLGTNYPLRTGGWKYGKPPSRREQGVESDQDDSELEISAAPAKKRKAVPVQSANQQKKKQHKDQAVVADKGKGKKKRVRPQSDESEVDQLASDESDNERSDDEGDDDEEAVVYTKGEALEEEAYWLDPSAHKAGGDTYRKAALFQLVYYDYDMATEAQIRKLWDRYHQLYAPTWMALYRKKKADDLVELRGLPRDALYIHLPDGKLKKRVPGPKSKFLDREIAWLEKYVEVGGCKRKMALEEPDLVHDHDSDEARPKKKETKEQRRARTSAASGSGHKAKGAAKVQLKPKASTSSSSSSKHQQKKKKKQQRAPRSESDESENGGYDDVDLDAAARYDECIGSDGGGGGRNSAGWGPEGAKGTFNQRRRNGGAFGRRFGGGGAGASGAYGVKEEEVEAFSGAGFRLGD
ncbi:hypothetical protein JCM8208_006937 [Rhodotorula glutinis]